MHFEPIACPHALGGSGQWTCGELSLLVIFMVKGRVSGVSRSLLFVHIGKGLASVVDNLVGPFQQVVDLIVNFELPVVLVHVADLSLLIGCPDIFLEVQGV